MPTVYWSLFDQVRDFRAFKNMKPFFSILDANSTKATNYVQSERVITEEEIISQLYIIMTAGYDSTANALSCAMYEIAKNQRVLREIQKELDEFCTEKVGVC